MDTVRFNSKGGPVLIKIKVTGSVQYRYKYFADDKTFRGDDTSNGNHMHWLGTPDELHLDFNNWRFGMSNITGADQDYVIEINWEQDNKTLSTWAKPGEISSTQMVAEEADSTMLFGD